MFKIDTGVWVDNSEGTNKTSVIMPLFTKGTVITLAVGGVLTLAGLSAISYTMYRLGAHNYGIAYDQALVNCDVLDPTGIDLNFK